MRIAYYVLFGAFGLLGAWFVVSSLFGSFSLGTTPPAFARVSWLLGAVASIALLYWAYLLGETQQRWGAGIGAIVLAVLAFQAVQVLALVGWSVAMRVVERL